nr:signal peptidase I [uncultured Caproiciproducens sp.]
MKKTTGIIGKIISTITLLCVVVVAVIVAGPRIIGWQPYEVLSGSMEPTYHVGSVIYVNKTAAQNVSVNDPITFLMSDGTTIVTHRVVKIDAQNKLFYTKGDANKVEDGGATPFSRLVGKPVFSIPGLGYFTSFLNTRRGMIIVGTILFCLIILTFLPDLLMKIGQNRGETKIDGESKEG